MRVLVACEYSGTVRDAFAAKGHYAISCDLLPAEKPGNHFQGDIFELLRYTDKFDLLIAHPPCTHLSSAGAYLWQEKQSDGRQQEAIEFVLKLMSLPIEKICIENPSGILSRVLQKPTQIVHPYYFCEKDSLDYVMKRTCLWLKNLPRLIFEPKTKPMGLGVFQNGPKKGQQIHWTAYKSGSKTRSKTFGAIANAMADQWG